MELAAEGVIGKIVVRDSKVFLTLFIRCTGIVSLDNALGIGEGAARMRLSRARKRLHRQMEGEMTP